MSQRSDLLNHESLDALLRHHPYLLIFQKEDWREYLAVLASIYDLLENRGTRVEYETIRSLVAKFYGTKNLQALDAKVMNFFIMTIGELQVLKDTHDQHGQRYLETTRSGQALLQMIETLVAQRTKFSGTGAETLVGALNDILISRKQMSEEEAIAHHREKIAAYKEDVVRIKREGLPAAKLLPVAHSNEALFSQAEEAAAHILDAIEDVKAAIESQRESLASAYFENRRSAGDTLSSVADFYEALYVSPEYASYVQAKDLLLRLDSAQTRSDVDHLIHAIERKELLPQEQIRRSNLRGFMGRFLSADRSIQDKVSVQLRLLQQQVQYSLANDVSGLRARLTELQSLLTGRPLTAVTLFDEQPIELRIPAESRCGPLLIHSFSSPPEAPSAKLIEETFGANEERELFLALIQADEGTLKTILDGLFRYLETKTELRSRDYDFSRGLAEYYVFSEAALFSDRIIWSDDGIADTQVTGKYGEFILHEAAAFTLKLRNPHGKT